MATRVDLGCVIGKTNYVKRNYRVVITENTNSVAIPEGADILFVYLNGMFLLEGTDYTYTANSITFTNVIEPDNVCEFSILYPVAGQADQVHYSKRNYSVNITSNTNHITIPSNVYNDGADILFIYLNGVFLLEGIDYSLVENNIIFTNTIEAGNTCMFAVLYPTT